MNRPSTLAAARTVMLGMWLEQRRNLLLLLGVVAGTGLAFRLMGSTDAARSGAWVAYLAMALSLCGSFVLCSFTEEDRRSRQVGFPARLFNLPISTPALVAAPMVFGVVVVCGVYLAWARFGLGDQQLPVSWPVLYLAAGVLAYQAIVWTLAGHRVLRIVVLGYAGAIFAIAWMAFREESSDFAPEFNVGLSASARTALCWMLAGAGAVAFLMAWVAVEAQRCGRRVLSLFRRRNGETRSPATAPVPTQAITSKGIRSKPSPFQSATAAQFWFEWRRHGRILPLATAGVLLMIMAPAPFADPVSSGMTLFALTWILATPLLIAFVIGKGMGKADLWSSSPGMPLFLATKPLRQSERIAAKLKAAGAAALSCWLLVTVCSAVWLWLWCDVSALREAWTRLRADHSATWISGCVVLFALGLVTFTFRLLAGSLFVGLSGRRWMINAAACWVFSAFFGAIALALTCSQQPDLLRNVFPPPAWCPWALGGAFSAKVSLSLVFAGTAWKKQQVSGGAIRSYAILWLSITTLLLVLTGLLFPVPTESRNVAMLALLFIMPMTRLAVATLVQAVPPLSGIVSD